MYVCTYVPPVNLCNWLRCGVRMLWATCFFSFLLQDANGSSKLGRPQLMAYVAWSASTSSQSSSLYTHQSYSSSVIEEFNYRQRHHRRQIWWKEFFFDTIPACLKTPNPAMFWAAGRQCTIIKTNIARSPLSGSMIFANFALDTFHGYLRMMLSGNAYNL